MKNEEAVSAVKKHGFEFDPYSVDDAPDPMLFLEYAPAGEGQVAVYAKEQKDGKIEVGWDPATMCSTGCVGGDDPLKTYSVGELAAKTPTELKAELTALIDKSEERKLWK